MPNRFYCLATLGAAALLLGACTVNSHTTVNANGAGALAYEIGLSKTDADTLSGLGQTPDQFCDSLNTQSDLPAGATITRERRGADYYCIISTPFASLAALRRAYAGTKGITVNELQIADGKFIYDVTVDGASAASDAGQFGGFQPSVNWQVTVPGTVGNNNADKVDGRTLTWDISTAGARNIHVESTAGGLSLPGGSLGALAAVLCGCLFCVGMLAAGGGGVFWFIRRNKKKPEPARESTGTASPELTA